MAFNLPFRIVLANYTTHTIVLPDDTIFIQIAKTVVHLIVKYADGIDILSL